VTVLPGSTLTGHIAALTDPRSDHTKRLRRPRSRPVRAVFLAWVQSAVALTDGAVIAVAGKTVCRSHDRGGEGNARAAVLPDEPRGCGGVRAGGDESRARTGASAENLVVPRYIALNTLKQERTAKVGVRNKRIEVA
jgi:hypothetical protein